MVIQFRRIWRGNPLWLPSERADTGVCPYKMTHLKSPPRSIFDGLTQL